MFSVTLPCLTGSSTWIGEKLALMTVGLPETAVRESSERVKAALRNCGYVLPPQRITINLAPADVKKEGSAFDLPIAVGILGAAGRLRRGALHLPTRRSRQNANLFLREP